MHRLSRVSKYFFTPVFFVFMAMLILHLKLPSFNDDLAFRDRIMEFGALGYLKAHGFQRAFLQAIMIPFLMNFKLFKVANVLIVTLLFISLDRLLNEKSNRVISWFVCFAVLIYPFWHMGTAGYVVTSIAYLWALFFLICSVHSIKKVMLHKRIRIWEGIVFSLFTILGANSEQGGFVLIVLYIAVFIYPIVSRIKMAKWNYFFVFLQIMFATASFLFAILSPWTRNRAMGGEVEMFFPSFLSLSIVQKLLLGYASTFYYYIFQCNVVFIVFCLLLFLLIHARYNDLFFRTIAAIPLGIAIVFGFTSWFIKSMFPEIIRITEFGAYSTSMDTTIDVSNFSDFRSYIPIFLTGICFACILAAFYLAFVEHPVKARFGILILILGFGTRVMLGLSPTVYASYMRTYIYMYFAFIICAGMLFEKLVQMKWRHIGFMNVVFGVLAILSLLQSMFQF